MTLEQTKQWQAAVMRAYPAPASDGQECTLEEWQDYRAAEATLVSLMPKDERITFLRHRLRKDDERLSDWHLPEWLLTTRNKCVTWSYEPQAELAFRSDVALIGMQFRYPTPEAQTQPYQRLLLGFLSTMLRPLVEQTEANNDTDLRHDFEGYFQICQLCESDNLSKDPQRWLDIQNDYAIHRQEVTVKTRARFLVDWITKLVRRILFQIDDPAVLGITRGIGQVLFYLPSEYDAAQLYGYHIAPAFLEVLEAECPPPDWLPRL